MTNDTERQRANARILEDETLISKLKNDEAKALIDWAVSELAINEGSLDERVTRLRAAMSEINELVGERLNLVADDLEERMAALLVSELDPKSQLRLATERNIAQVTAEKDHIEASELVRRLTLIATTTWRARANAPRPVSVELIMPVVSTTAAAASHVAVAAPAARQRPIPRPTKIEPRKPGLLDRLLGRK